MTAKYADFDPLKRQLGERVKALRINANLTQRQAAERAGVNQANLSRIERGVSSPRLDSLLRLQHCFGLDTIEALLSPLPSQQVLDTPDDQDAVS